MKKYTIIIYVSLLILLVFPIFIYADNNQQSVSCVYPNLYTFTIDNDRVSIFQSPEIKATTLLGEKTQDVRSTSFYSLYKEKNSCPSVIYHCEYLEHTYRSSSNLPPENKYTYDICSDINCNNRYGLKNVSNSYGVEKNCVEL